MYLFDGAEPGFFGGLVALLCCFGIFNSDLSRQLRGSLILFMFLALWLSMGPLSKWYPYTYVYEYVPFANTFAHQTASSLLRGTNMRTHSLRIGME